MTAIGSSRFVEATRGGPLAHAQGRTIAPLAECGLVYVVVRREVSGHGRSLRAKVGFQDGPLVVDTAGPGHACCRNGGSRRDGDGSRSKPSRSAKRGLLCCAWNGGRDRRMCPGEYLRLRGSRSTSRWLVSSGSARFEHSPGEAVRSALQPSGRDKDRADKFGVGSTRGRRFWRRNVPSRSRNHYGHDWADEVRLRATSSPGQSSA
jgi:hypothetical protein